MAFTAFDASRIPQFFAAKHAKIRYGPALNPEETLDTRNVSITLPAKRWSVNIEAEEIETTHAEDRGNYSCIRGITKCSVEVVFDYGADMQIFDVPQIPLDARLRSGLYVAMQLFLREPNNIGAAGQGPKWVFPKLYIRSVQPAPDVRGTVLTTLSGVGSGRFVWPVSTPGRDTENKGDIKTTG